VLSSTRTDGGIEATARQEKGHYPPLRQLVRQKDLASIGMLILLHRILQRKAEEQNFMNVER